VTVSSRTESEREWGINVLDWITALEDTRPTVSGLVADFWWLAHDDTGVPRLRIGRTGGAMGLGLSAALLGDLVLVGQLRIDDQGVLRVRDGELPSDPLTRHAFAQIRGAPAHGLQDWLAALAVDVYGRVADRLAADGLVHAVEVRRRGRLVEARGGRRRPLFHYPPTHHLSAVQPAVLLSRRLARHEPVDEQEALLLAIAGATGLRSLLVESGDRDVDTYVRWLIAGLTGISRDIALATRAAMTRAVLTHRS
jgi:hypothetical protein